MAQGRRQLNEIASAATAARSVHFANDPPFLLLLSQQFYTIFISLCIVQENLRRDACRIMLRRQFLIIQYAIVTAQKLEMTLAGLGEGTGVVSLEFYDVMCSFCAEYAQLLCWKLQHSHKRLP